MTVGCGPPLSCRTTRQRCRSRGCRNTSPTLRRSGSDHDALRHGEYTELHVASEQFAFRRQAGDDTVIVAINAAVGEATIEVESGVEDGTVLIDALDDDVSVTAADGRFRIPLAANSARIMVR